APPLPRFGNYFFRSLLKPSSSDGTLITRQSPMMLQVLLLLLATAAAAAEKEYCNQGTSRSCECASCWDDLPITGGIDWITIETDGCDETIDERSLRTRLASWSSEECGASVHCGIRLPISPDQILLGRLSCDSNTRAGAISIAMIASPVAKEELSQDSLLSASLLGAILHSREHLLAIALRAHLTSVSITRRSATVPRRTTPRTTSTVFTITTTVSPRSTVVDQRDRSLFFIPTSTTGIVLAACCFSLAIVALVVYSMWGRIEWKRLAEGRWKRRVYRKVPDVMFRSADEMPTVIPPHSSSFHSTTQLIRY
ncbi:hypothetical protein PENTCL1PPCAC_27678, partial [Pristionchus entomophagus]